MNKKNIKIALIALLSSILLFSCENKSNNILSLTLDPNLPGYEAKTIITLENKSEALPNASDIWNVYDYEFKGWAKTAAGSVSYKAGASYSQSSSSILFAVWSLIGDSEEVLSDEIYSLSADGVLTVANGASLSGDVVVPKTIKGRTVKAIGKEAFKDTTGIKSITLPDTIISIEEGAFRGSKDLLAITIPDSVALIGDLAFSDCTSLLSVSLPDSILEAGAGLFYGCEKLRAVKLPKYVKYLKQYSDEKGFFENCTSLTSVVLPESLIALGGEAFYGCSSLETIELTSKLEAIGKSAFYNCSKLTGVTLTASITTIAQHAFTGTPMTSIRYAAKEEDWNKISKGDSWKGNISKVIAKDAEITV